MSSMEIRLQTPPASPVLLSLDDLPSPESIIQNNVKKQSYTVISPQKKPRHPGSGSKKDRRKRTFRAGDTDDSLALQNETFYGVHPEDDSSTYGLNSIDGLPDSLDIGRSSPTTVFDETDSDNLEYYTYAESVFDFVAGLFQVSATLFVVQGWDMKRASATKTRLLSSVAVRKGISIAIGIASM
ncbi:hypothetical protein F5887DRAFT_915983 [Amanita rubescens]|nr:hypothetical protein F5887DRAFT_915983 [Amanita rubescens]